MVLFFLLFVPLFLPFFFPHLDPFGGPLGALPWFLAMVVVQAFLYLGMIRLALNVHDGRPAPLGNLMERPGLVILFWITSVLCWLMIEAGFLLLIVPGILLCARWGFYPIVIVDRGLWGFAALRESWKITKGASWPWLFVFLLGLQLFTQLGLIALGIGLFVTVPVSLLMWVHVYRVLEGQSLGEAGNPRDVPAGATPAAEA